MKIRNRYKVKVYDNQKQVQCNVKVYDKHVQYKVKAL